jgi:RNAse (barnase) inhibitor barstar
MAPFRLGKDELAHELPWRLMRNGPVTLYRRQDYFEQDIAELREREYLVPVLDCLAWGSVGEMHDALRLGLGLPDYTGRNFDALADSLSEIDVPEHSGTMVALDNVTRSDQTDMLLDVLADASRRWLLFGRIFGILVRTDNPSYDGPVIGATRPSWNGREWRSADRAL